MIFWNKFCGLVLILLITGPCSPAQNTTLSGVNVNFLLKNKLINSGAFIHFTLPLSRCDQSATGKNRLFRQIFIPVILVFFVKKNC